MAKLLIALDSSKGAWSAVEYVAKTFGNTPGVQVTLFHVLSGLPPAFQDDGHIMEEKERDSRQRLVAAWRQDQEKQWRDLVHKANQHLGAAGLPPRRCTTSSNPNTSTVAEDILEEAQAGAYDTVVMGRRGLGLAKSLLLGSVTRKVVDNANGCAVTIVA
ncbi:MAG: universal stress protein [Desulfobaccales bacterium]